LEGDVRVSWGHSLRARLTFFQRERDEKRECKIQGRGQKRTGISGNLLYSNGEFMAYIPENAELESHIQGKKLFLLEGAY